MQDASSEVFWAGTESGVKLVLRQGSVPGEVSLRISANGDQWSETTLTTRDINALHHMLRTAVLVVQGYMDDLT